MRMIVQDKLLKNELYELRKLHQISQMDLAIQCGFTLYRLGCIERGEKVPTLLEAHTLADYFREGINDVFVVKDLSEV